MKTAFMFFLCAASALTGCVYEVADPTQPLSYDENLVKTTLNLTVNDFEVSTTRAEDPSTVNEPVSEKESHVSDIWVFQYRAEGGTLATAPIYKVIEEQTELDALDIELSEVLSDVYVVANTGSSTWAENAYDFNTPELLLAQEIPSPFPIIFGTEEERDIPMEGKTAASVTPTQNTVRVPVERMYAKIKVYVEVDDELVANSDASVNSVSLRKIPWYCRVGTLYDETNMSMAAEYPDDIWITRAINEENEESDGDEACYVFYIPENIQGEVAGNSSSGEKANVAPFDATSIVARIDYTEDGTGASMYKYFTACPGGNDYNNYNVRRNCVYRVTMNISYPIEEEWQPSANCIYAAPGSTVSFEPYYRVEEGGSYTISDYIKPDVESGTGVQIEAVRILWQTEGCIGDNSEGNLVYFEPLVNEDASDQTLHSKIYVTVARAGNAVIAAYDKDPDSYDDAKIIWSWHIWAPNADVPDPTNEANGKLYYTYYWDENGIYGYRTADVDDGGVVTGYSRIPGYTIMNLNLGALAATPTDVTETSTYGLIYQWGRKDPFPSLKSRGSIIGDTDFPAYDGYVNYGNNGETYDESLTELLYGNDGARISGMTALEDDSKLFHSVSGNTIQSYDYGVAYTIENPTVYMCGTSLAGAQATTESYTADLNNYTFGGSWTGHESDDLWGTIDFENAGKSLVVGVDDVGERHIYDDFGEKTIYDPCPYGWCVSPPDLWLGFTATGGEVNGEALEEHEFDDINAQTVQANGFWFYLTDWKSGETSFFPNQGARLPDGCGVSRICGTYVNASPDTDHRANTLHIHSRANSSTDTSLYSYYFVKIFEMDDFFYYARSCGGAVRCVREEK